MRPSMIFEVQKIIGISTDDNGNVRTFQVQWAPSWVSDHHLVGCEKLIEEFLTGLSEEQDAEFVDDKSLVIKGEQSFVHDTVFSKQGNEFADNSDTQNEHLENDFSKQPVEQNIDSGVFVSNSLESSDEPIKIEEKESILSEDTRFNDENWNSISPFSSSLPSSSFDGIHKLVNNSNDTNLGSSNISNERNQIDLVDKHWESTDNGTNTGKFGMLDRNYITHNTVSQGFSTPIRRATNQCEICGKQFHNTFNMNRHMRSTHFGETRHECSVCGKRWYQKSQLTQHMKKHIKEKSFNCKMCKETFASKLLLTRHDCSSKLFPNISHDKDYDNCQYCGEEVYKINIDKHICTDINDNPSFIIHDGKELPN